MLIPGFHRLGITAIRLVAAKRGNILVVRHHIARHGQRRKNAVGIGVVARDLVRFVTQEVRGDLWLADVYNRERPSDAGASIAASGIIWRLIVGGVPR